MKIAICTIQRNRGQWLKEWFAFHYAIGVRKFYFFAHKCTDNTNEVILELKKYFDINAFVLSADLDRPQLSAYQYAYQNFNHEFDWIAFIDGDEFLFPSRHQDLREVMENYSYRKISGLAAYWACFGSSGHIIEPEGLVTENYRYRANYDFEPNRHIKSIIRGHQGDNFSVLQNSHYFKTIHGIIDADNRSIQGGFTQYEPNYEVVKINHYVTQSFTYFKSFKQSSGAADSNLNYVRPESWWDKYNRNEVYDNSLSHINLKIKETMNLVGC
jgi:hypothetical protein